MNQDVHSTRVTLLDRVRDNDDENAWNEFCNFYWDLIHGWAKRMGCSEHQSQDVFQETIINLLKQMKGFEYDPKKGCFRAFLKTIVRCRVSDSFRRNGRYINASAFESEDNKDFQLMDQFVHDIQPETLEDDVVWLDSILRQSLRRAYTRIDEASYKSFCMYVLEQQPIEIVMKKLNIKRQGAIYQQKSRFLTILKKEFHKLLDELGSSPESEQMNNLDERVFSHAIARLIEGRQDLRNTLSETAAPLHLKEKLNFIKSHLQSSDMPEASGDYLLIIPIGSNSRWQRLTDSLAIGRSDKAGLQLDKDGVSGLHASIYESQTGWTLKDEVSTNGTFLNGNKLAEPELLKNGDIIQISSHYSLIFVTG
jgi:RNA polymerase sigma factor (sigma-70 family)